MWDRATVRWLIDEIQLAPGWERFVRRVLDSENATLVVSGSSASLRPRARSKVETRFVEYLAKGGVPEVLSTDAATRIDLLQGYLDAVLFRDVVERHGVAHVAALRWVTRQCPSNPGGAFIVHRLAQDPKAQGLGLARAFYAGERTSADHTLETVVLNALDERKADVGYVRTPSGYEVDFVARYRKGGGTRPGVRGPGRRADLRSQAAGLGGRPAGAPAGPSAPAHAHG